MASQSLARPNNGQRNMATGSRSNQYGVARNIAPYSIMPLSEAVSQLFRDAFTSPFSGGTMSGLPINLYERDDSYLLQIPLPGARADQLTISARENVVTLQGTTELPAPEGARPIFEGASTGQFREQVVLPGDVDAEQAKAEYRDGVLTLTLPKAQHARERTIAVSHATGQSTNGQQAQNTNDQTSSAQSSSR